MAIPGSECERALSVIIESVHKSAELQTANDALKKELHTLKASYAKASAEVVELRAASTEMKQRETLLRADLENKNLEITKFSSWVNTAHAAILVGPEIPLDDNSFGCNITVTDKQQTTKLDKILEFIKNCGWKALLTDGASPQIQDVYRMQTLIMQQTKDNGKKLSSLLGDKQRLESVCDEAIEGCKETHETTRQQVLNDEEAERIDVANIEPILQPWKNLRKRPSRRCTFGSADKKRKLRKRTDPAEAFYDAPSTSKYLLNRIFDSDEGD